MKTKIVYVISALFTLVVCILIATTKISVSVNVNDNVNALDALWSSLFGKSTSVAVTPAETPVAVPDTTPVTTPEATSPSASAPAATEPSSAPAAETPQSSSLPTSTKDIIDKYTVLVDKFKKEKPAYKKKEFQALPEEYRNFGSAVNVILDLASGYMVTEDAAEELVRSAGAQEILNDVPIHNSEKGCVLTDYDAVSWAKCEDNGDGTYKISFSLKEEYNAEPTPADTLVPVSAHGAVMQPISIADITKEVDSITSKVPGLALNQFELIYRDCVFECVYDPTADQVKSITHHTVIDINADIKLFVTDIAGSARLLNEMYIYDIAW